jgi:phosphatidylserine decarboxylase
VPVPITSVQPGGGLGMGLELAWGRLRRWYLRRFRPGYVARMAAKRQGDCPGCPHDVIDPRDLKYYRNVCGYWFRDEDDRFRWRGRLGLARIGWVEILCLSAFFLALKAAVILLFQGILWLYLPLSLAIFLVWVEAILFFRDPEREIPADPQALLSPADGTITDIGEVAEPDFPGGQAFRISIFLSIFNVHVNRIPRTGRVTALRYYPGGFLDARHPDCSRCNEQLWIDLEEAGTGRPLRVKQIAGKIARRIVCWLRNGEEVQAGDRLGMIKFGSRTEVLLPAGEAIELCVKVGDKVEGGSSVLLRLPVSPGPTNCRAAETVRMAAVESRPE